VALRPGVSILRIVDRSDAACGRNVRRMQACVRRKPRRMRVNVSALRKDGNDDATDPMVTDPRTALSALHHRSVPKVIRQSPAFVVCCPAETIVLAGRSLNLMARSWLSSDKAGFGIRGSCGVGPIEGGPLITRNL
jgi:hypothetical protein